MHSIQSRIVESMRRQVEGHYEMEGAMLTNSCRREPCPPPKPASSSIVAYVDLIVISNAIAMSCTDQRLGAVRLRNKFSIKTRRMIDTAGCVAVTLNQTATVVSSAAATANPRQKDCRHPQRKRRSGEIGLIRAPELARATLAPQSPVRRRAI